MSGVREADRRIEMKSLDEEPILVNAPVLKRTVVSRALAVSRAIAPLLRVTTREGASLPVKQIDLQAGSDYEPPRKVNVVLISLILVVLLPILTSGVYLFFIASDQYASEARFAIRTNSADDGSKGDTSLSGLLSGGGSLGGQEAEIVANYIHSRAIIEDVSRTLDVRAIFRRPESDFFAALPKDASSEDLTLYWNKMVSVYIESLSGIVTVQGRAFRRDDALALVKAIVKSSEALVNDMSMNVRADAMKHAEDEVQRSEGLVRFALAEMTAFRNSQGLIDPVKSADQTGKLLLQLEGDAIQTETQLFVAQRTMGDNAPGVTGTRAKLESINSHIAQLQQQLAGDKDGKSNMASNISRFEELELKRQFSERIYGFARDGMDRARLIAERHSVYLAQFVKPSLPEDYSYPLRGTDFALIAIGVVVAWCCGATIWASVLDHRL